MSNANPLPKNPKALPDLTLVRELDRIGHDSRQHVRAAAIGTEVRVRRGGYVDARAWQALDQRGRYVLLVRTVAETRREKPILSHWSAAALYGLPIIGSWPTTVHLTVPATRGGRSGYGIVRHGTVNPGVPVETDGLLVTSLERTLIDLASVASFVTAVTAMDRTLRTNRDGTRAMTTKQRLWDEWERMRPFRAHSRTREAISFAVDGADSPLESLSRANMHIAGLPAPQLQKPFFDYRGFIAEVDFTWEKYGLLGETDGNGKYLDAALRKGKTPEQVVLAEKWREDRLRALPNIRVSRWDWTIALSPELLRRHLVTAGLPLVHVGSAERFRALNAHLSDPRASH
ncbi:MAG: hypothetical protein ACYCZY_02660 [Lacisediminihabitans sp.]